MYYANGFQFGSFNKQHNMPSPFGCVNGVITIIFLNEIEIGAGVQWYIAHVGCTRSFHDFL